MLPVDWKYELLNWDLIAMASCKYGLHCCCSHTIGIQLKVILYIVLYFKSICVALYISLNVAGNSFPPRWQIQERRQRPSKAEIFLWFSRSATNRLFENHPCFNMQDTKVFTIIFSAKVDITAQSMVGRAIQKIHLGLKAPWKWCTTRFQQQLLKMWLITSLYNSMMESQLWTSAITMCICSEWTILWTVWHWIWPNFPKSKSVDWRQWASTSNPKPT